MIPVTLGLGLINFNALIGTLFASRYIDPRISPSAIDAAFRIYMLPQGTLGRGGDVLFPSIRASPPAATCPLPRRGVLGIRQIMFLLVPASVVVAVLAEPIRG